MGRWPLVCNRVACLLNGRHPLSLAQQKTVKRTDFQCDWCIHTAAILVWHNNTVQLQSSPKSRHVFTTANWVAIASWMSENTLWQHELMQVLHQIDQQLSMPRPRLNNDRKPFKHSYVHQTNRHQLETICTALVRLYHRSPSQCNRKPITKQTTAVDNGTKDQFIISIMNQWIIIHFLLLINIFSLHYPTVSNIGHISFLYTSAFSYVYGYR